MTGPRKNTLQLKIQLRGVEPPVWRQLRVPGDATLAALIEMLNAAMGWEDAHLSILEIGAARYMRRLEAEGELIAEHYTVLPMLSDVPRFLYRYGVNWEHDVTVERRTGHHLAWSKALCIAGENACPPEGVDHVARYETWLRVAADPRHPDHRSHQRYIPKGFDRTAFNIAAINDELFQITYGPPGDPDD